MNENINLVEILKDCPIGTKLYSPLAGEVEFRGINYDCESYPIEVRHRLAELAVTKEGLHYSACKDGECMLFPSRDQRDWSKFKLEKPKFDPKTLQPFDRVIILGVYDNWECAIFSHIDNTLYDIQYVCVGDVCRSIVIPYNDDTKYLVGTSDEAPEFYRYWES